MSTATTRLTTVICLLVVSLALFLCWNVRTPGPSGGIGTTFYSIVEGSARKVWLLELAQWAGDRRVASWERELERRVHAGAVSKLFLRRTDGRISQDQIFATFPSFSTNSYRLLRGAEVDPFQYECPASESPSYLAYVDADDTVKFESLWRESGIIIIPEPSKKSVEQRYWQRPIAGATYVAEPFANVLFDIVKQQPRDTQLAFAIHENALASGHITIELPEGLDLKQGIDRLCQLVECEYKVDVYWGEPDLLYVSLERPGARERVGISMDSSWPARETVVVEPSHIHMAGCPCSFGGSAHQVDTLQQQGSDQQYRPRPRAEPVAPREPPLRSSFSDAPDNRTLDPLPAPSSGGGR